MATDSFPVSKPTSKEWEDGVQGSAGIKLKKALDIRDIKSHAGAVFEIDEDELCNNLHENGQDIESSVGKQNLDHDMLSVCSGINNKYEDESSEVENDIEPFEKLAAKMEDISGDEGVLKMELEGGVGNDPSDGSVVLFHYSAFLEYSDEPFDSTVLRNKPQKACLSENDTLLGLKIGLKSMRKREKSLFLVQPKYAFGEMGCPPRIPPSATILYEVKLIDAVDRSGLNDFENMGLEEQHSASFSQKFKAAKDYVREGNDHAKEKRLPKAKNCYQRAVWLLETTTPKNKEDQQKQGEMLFRIHSNLAQVNLDMKEPTKACTQCHLALEIPLKFDDVMKAKLYFRYAKAKMTLNDFSISKKYLLKAQHLRPNNQEISTLLEELVKRKQRYFRIEKIMCKKMLGMNTSDQDLANRTNEDSLHDECVDNAWQAAFDSQIESFRSNKERRELPLPPNLTVKELNYASTRVAKFDMKVEKHQIGSCVLWKIVKP